MANEADRSIEQAVEQLKVIFAQLKLTSDEARFVNEAGRSIFVFAFEQFERFNERHQHALRPIAIAVAIANLIGPHDVWDRGVDCFQGR